MKKFLICLIGRMMKLSVFTATREKHKIFKPIIISNMVDMVYNFCRQKVSSKVLFHNKARAFNIPISITKRMVRSMKKNISLMFHYAFVAPMFISRKATHFFKRFLRIRIFLSFIPRFNSSFYSFIPRDGAFHRFCIAFFRTIFLFINMAFFNIKKVFANRAFNLLSCFSFRWNQFKFSPSILTFFRTKLFPLSQRFFNLNFFSTHKTSFNHNFSFVIVLFSITFLTLFVKPCQAVENWRNGTGENTILGSESASDIDSVTYNNYTVPLDRLLADYRSDCEVQYLSASTLTVKAGSVTLSNSGGTIRIMQQNTADTTVTWSMIDTAPEEASTTYYVYAYQETVGDSDFDVTISKSSSTPTGKTYYARLGSFYNNSSSNIDQNNTLTNDNFDITTAQVISTDLKTTTGEVTGTGGDFILFRNTGNAPGASYAANIVFSSNYDGAGDDLTLPGGTYGFYPQFKKSGSTRYAKQRYVTASGLDHWIFLLVNKSAKDVIQTYQAPDHPAYGNGGDFVKIPHPFLNYNSGKHWVILVEKENAETLKAKAKEQEKTLLTLINDDYKVDYTTVEKYVPLHSGQFLGKKPVLVYEIPNYIKVKKLIPLTDSDRVVKENKEEAKRLASEQKKANKEANKKTGKSKLKAGEPLTDDEIDSLFD